MNINGAVVFITGASSGIAAQAAQIMAQRGAKTVLVARRKERLQQLADQIEERGGVALALECDVTDRVQVECAVAATVERFGSIDIVINSAASPAYGAVEDLEAEAFRTLIETNVISVLNVVQATLPYLKRNKGMVVTLTSFLGIYPLPYLGALGATKAMVNALTVALRSEIKGSGVKVLNYGPPETESEFHASEPKRTGRKRAKAEDVARSLVRSIEQEKRQVIYGRFFTILNCIAPSRLDALFYRAIVAKKEGR